MWRPQVLHVGLALLPSDGSEVLGTADPPLFGYAFAETPCGVAYTTKILLGYWGH